MALFDVSDTEQDFDDNSNDNDFLFALQLQNQFNQETKSEKQVNTNHQIGSLSVVDKQWELIDPNPNVHELFIQFNHQFFYRRLDSVYVEWSKRMTRCAGICYYRRGGECRIALSASYLSLRPRKDLVETLLHEMIHAYLFVTHNNRDRDGHGPEFLKHMIRINDSTGANISVYHSFHDEYDHLHGHWWRCTGPCRDWKPFYGYVKRSMNRVPSNRDRWWGEHERRCGGQFEKIKEPDNYKGKDNKKRPVNDISSNGTEVTSGQSSKNETSTITKKRKKPNSSSIPSNGTIDKFFKKTKLPQASSNIVPIVSTTKNTPINVGQVLKAENSENTETNTNYVNCPNCNTFLPKGNLFIHQIRCHK